MAQIREAAATYRELAARGVQVFLISPQPASHTRRLAGKFDVPFHFLTDIGNQAARQLGIAQKDGIPTGYALLGYESETVFPTVIITDASGKIIFADLTDSYRYRPDPQTFLRALDNDR
jgi:peroxiredoxin